MLLTLKPPSDYLIPAVFHTHTLATPKLPSAKHLKIPPSYVQAKKQLNDVGLRCPHYLSADKALWWHFVILEVVWDLDVGQVVVKFTDGTRDSFDFEEFRSRGILSDNEDSERRIEHEERSRGSVTKEQAFAMSFPSRWSPEIIFSQLVSFSVKLRSAYEDITASSFLRSTSERTTFHQDLQTIMALSADPSLDLPIDWVENQTASRYFMEEDSVEETENDELNEFGEAVEQPCRGQLRSRRRPQHLEIPRESSQISLTFSSTTITTSTLSSTSGSYDYLSTVALLAEIRTYLLNLLPSSIYPQLQASYGPTYSLWAAEGAISWCRKRAIERGGEVGLIILELLEDEPDVLLETSSASSDLDHERRKEDNGERDGEESWGIETHEISMQKQRGQDDSRWMADCAKVDKRRGKNPLDSMRDDFDLRCWAEDAIERQGAAEREQWLKRQAQPKWLNEPVPIEVSTPSDPEDEEDYHSDIDEPYIDQQKNVTGAATLRPSSSSKLKGIGPLSSPTVQSIEQQDDCNSVLLPSPSASSASSTSSEASETPSKSPSKLDSSGAFFFPRDHLGEEFLPRKLPRAVVTPNVSRDSSMEKARALLHSKSNEIAGLERKIVELLEFSDEELRLWQSGHEVQGKTKDKHSSSASGLRGAGPSSKSPPPTPRIKRTVPLKAQPLLLRTADSLLTTRLARAMEGLEPRASKRKTTYQDIQCKISLPNGKSGKRRSVLATPKPRKRQKFNLEALDKVEALKLSNRRDAALRGLTNAKQRGPDGLRRTKGALTIRSDEPTRREEEEGLTGQQAAKQSGKVGKSLVRQHSEVNLERFVYATTTSPSSSPSKVPNSAARLSRLELATRRPYNQLVVETSTAPGPLLKTAPSAELTASTVSKAVQCAVPKSLTELELEGELIDQEHGSHTMLDYENSNISNETLPRPAGGVVPSQSFSICCSCSTQGSASPFPPDRDGHSSLLDFPLSRMRHSPENGVTSQTIPPSISSVSAEPRDQALLQHPQTSYGSDSFSILQTDPSSNPAASNLAGIIATPIGSEGDIG